MLSYLDATENITYVHVYKREYKLNLHFELSAKGACENDI